MNRPFTVQDPKVRQVEPTIDRERTPMKDRTYLKPPWSTRASAASSPEDLTAQEVRGVER